MIADLFWNVATSNIVLSVIGAIALAAIIVSHVPLIRWIPTIDHYMKLASAIGYVALSLFFLLVGFRISDERAETKRLKLELAWSENQLEQQKATAEDSERLAREAEAKAEQLKTKVDDYEAALAKLPVGACALDDADLRRLRGIAR